jgi:L-ribulose-5-phosphate 3-epimerase
MGITRRAFIKYTGAAAMLSQLAPLPVQALNLNHSGDPLEVHIFSKHLQFLGWKEVGQVAAELGFDGVDLTVRPKGHVLPENVTSDLPLAINDIKQSGSECKMITTAVDDVNDPLDSAIIETAASDGVKYYRCNWFKFKKDQSLEESLEYYKEKVRQLAAFNKKHNIVGCYQNHSGTNVGASIWEVKKILETADPDFFGVQYDIRHAMAEGGKSWPNGVKLIKDQIKTIVLKDFKWGKVEGKWQIVNVPIGEGMVDFKSYFKLIKSFGLNPPASLHLEYPLGGAEKGRNELTINKKAVFDAMKKDLIAIQKLWKEA